MDDEPAADTVDFLAGVAGSFAAGARVAGYRVEKQLGQGGMAVVYLARDERLDRMVALKVLAPVLASDEEFRRRFIRESRAAAAVDDPHIIPVFEAGETDGLLYIAMRYVPGRDVLTIMNDDGPLPPGRAAAIISQVASALDAAHAAGLVHRDVKPANMLVDVRPGRPDHVYLSDFGLSKKTLTTSAGLTGKGQFLGTPDYTSPEQIQGKPPDGRADQYGLACAAFELLTGVPPFRREEATAVMYAHLSEPPPSAVSRRTDLPAVVDQVLARALAKAPADRYPSCQRFADALLQALGTGQHQVSLQTTEDPVPGHPPNPTDWVGTRGTGQQRMPAADAAEDTVSPLSGEAGMPTRDVDVPTPPADDADGSVPVRARSTQRGSSQKGHEAARNNRARAARLITDAERIARSITSESSKAKVLAEVAAALAATDPDRAERIARSITSESSKAKVLAEVAAALAATDPDRATRLMADADHIARSITDKSEKATALAEVATALAATDPDRAERIARSITSESRRPRRSPRSRRRWQPPTRTAPPGSWPTRITSPGPSPTSPRRPPRSRRSRRRWQPPTRTARNASPGPSPMSTSRPRCSPRSRRRWQPPTRTARNTLPGPSSASPMKSARLPTSRRHWQPPTRPAPTCPATRGCGSGVCGPWSRSSSCGVLDPGLLAARAHPRDDLRHRRHHLPIEERLFRAGDGTADRRSARRAAHRRRGTHCPVHHQQVLEGQRARRGRRGAGSHRPGPRRTHRPVHHQRVLKGYRARRGRGGAGSHRPGPRRTHRPVHHRRVLESKGTSDDR